MIPDLARRASRRAFLTALFALAACGSSPVAPKGDVQVRIANNSTVAFERVDVGFPEDAVNYGPVRANGVTDYRRVSTAYRYAYVEVAVGGEVLRIQPIDYVGETPLRAGRYTYALNITVEGYLTLELRED